MNKFEKVSYKQFLADTLDCFPQLRDKPQEFVEPMIRAAWEQIELPRRATKGSAGYDFFAPFGITFDYAIPVRFPTGIRCQIENGQHLQCFSRSSIAIKHDMLMPPYVIDEDYYHVDNEGHIFCRMVRTTPGSFHLEKGQGYMQGVFVRYGLTVDDNTTYDRTGGIGSTDKISIS